MYGLESGKIWSDECAWNASCQSQDNRKYC